MQDLKCKSKYCLISSRFAPINKRKIVSEKTHAQSHGTEATKQPSDVAKSTLSKKKF